MSFAELKKATGWYWVISVIFLGWGLFMNEIGFYLAILASAVQITHFFFFEGGLKAFPVQLRIAYAVLLLIFLWEPLNVLYWIPFIGTSAMIVFDYCLLARLLSLLPWVRKEPLTLAFIKKRIFSKPVKGCILD